MQEREAPTVCDQWLVQGNNSVGCLDPIVRSSRAGAAGRKEEHHIPAGEEADHHTEVDHKAVGVAVDRKGLAADHMGTVAGHIEAVEGKD